MTLFYKGIAVGTFLHTNDLRTTGIAARDPGATPSIDALMNHVARATTVSPYISLTRSYGVAKDYAIASRTSATAARPAYVYEIEIDAGSGLALIDPVCFVAQHHNNPFASPGYQHDGSQTFLLGVVDPIGMVRHLTAPAPQHKGASGTPRPPNLSMALETIVRALRDAEVIVVGSVPRSCIRARYDEY